MTATALWDAMEDGDAAVLGDAIQEMHATASTCNFPQETTPALRGSVAVLVDRHPVSDVSRYRGQNRHLGEDAFTYQLLLDHAPLRLPARCGAQLAR